MSKCELFNKIAADTWTKISLNHGRGNRLAEEGITRQTIVSDIQDYVEDNPMGFDVFAQKSNHESERGADLELYIDDGTRNFYRLLLQAKLTEVNGRFEDLNRFSGQSNIRQYDTLISYANSVNAGGYYIFYNGIPEYTCQENDCAGPHNELQYGCAIVNGTAVKTHCENNHTGIMTWDTLKPIGLPWRFIACCNNFNGTGLKRYKQDEIDADNHFQNIFTRPLIYFNTGRVPPQSEMERKNEQLNRKGWKPYARIVVVRNGKMKLDSDGYLIFKR